MESRYGEIVYLLNQMLTDEERARFLLTYLNEEKDLSNEDKIALEKILNGYDVDLEKLKTSIKEINKPFEAQNIYEGYLGLGFKSLEEQFKEATGKNMTETDEFEIVYDGADDFEDGSYTPFKIVRVKPENTLANSKVEENIPENSNWSNGWDGEERDNGTASAHYEASKVEIKNNNWAGDWSNEGEDWGITSAYYEHISKPQESNISSNPEENNENQVSIEEKDEVNEEKIDEVSQSTNDISNNEESIPSNIEEPKSKENNDVDNSKRYKNEIQILLDAETEYAELFFDGEIINKKPLVSSSKEKRELFKSLDVKGKIKGILSEYMLPKKKVDLFGNSHRKNMRVPSYDVKKVLKNIDPSILKVLADQKVSIMHFNKKRKINLLYNYIDAVCISTMFHDIPYSLTENNINIDYDLRHASVIYAERVSKYAEKSSRLSIANIKGNLVRPTLFEKIKNFFNRDYVYEVTPGIEEKNRELFANNDKTTNIDDIKLQNYDGHIEENARNAMGHPNNDKSNDISFTK